MLPHLRAILVRNFCTGKQKMLINAYLSLPDTHEDLPSVPLMVWRLPGKPGWISCRVPPTLLPSRMTQIFMESQGQVLPSPQGFASGHGFPPSEPFK